MTQLGLGKLGDIGLGKRRSPLRAFAGSTAGRPGADKRRRPRITIDELNTRGVAAIREKWPELDKAKQGLAETVEKRTALEKFFDWIDLPRNIVANAVGALTGVEKGKLPRAALGLRRVGAGDVLKRLGLKTGNAIGDAVIAFIGDVALDPLTYLSAGAMTGKLIARHVPRVIPAGMKTISHAIRTGRVPSVIGRAVGGASIAGKKPVAVAEMIAKAVTPGPGITHDMARAARSFFTEFGVRGRHVGRIPFTQIKTPALKFGKQAAVHRAVSTVGPEGVAAMRGAARAGQVMSRLRGRAAAIKASDLTDPQKKTALERLAASMKRVGAKKLEHEGATPELWRRARAAAAGKAYSPTEQPILWALQKKFGMGLESPQRLQELGITGEATIGASGAARRAAQQVRPLVDALTDKMLRTGAATNKQGARRLISYAIDIGDDAGLAALHADDAAHGSARAIRGVWSDPAYRSLIDKYKGLADDMLAKERAAGVRVGEVPDIGYLHRTLGEKAGKLSQEQQWLSGGVGGAGVAGQPFQARRVRNYAIRLPDGTTLTKNMTPEDAAKLVRERSTAAGAAEIISDRAISMAEHQRLFSEGRYSRVVGGGVDRAKVPSYFQEDPAASISSRAFQHQRAMASSRMKKLVQEHGVVVNSADDPLLREAGYRAVKELDANHPLLSIMGDASPYSREGTIRAFPLPVADMLERYSEVFKSDQALNTLLKPVDWTMGWFKRWALFSPAYVIRNVFQNAFGTLMAGGPKILFKQSRYMVSKPVRNIFKAIDADDLGQLAGQTMKIGGQTVPLDELAREFIRYNGHMMSRSVAEFAPELMRGGGTIQTAGRGAGRAVSAGADVVRNVNAAVEGQMRMGTWLAFMDDGLSAREAMMRTIYAMPDLADLTKFEKDVGRRIVPWISWARKNGALQLFHYLPQQPAWMASTKKFQNFLEAASPAWRGGKGVVPEELRPKWIRESQAPQVMGDKKEGSAFMMGSWFPFEETQSLLAGAISPTEATRQLAGQLRPGIKFIAETATGRDIFRGAPVKPFSMAEALGAVGSGKAFMGTSGTAMDNLMAIRPLREYGRRVPEQPTLAGKIGRGLFGGAIQPLSAEKGLKSMDIETRQQLSELRRLIATAKGSKDSAEVARLNNILRKFMAVQAQRQRLGARIPRSTERAFAGAGLAQQPMYGQQ